MDRAGPTNLISVPSNRYEVKQLEHARHRDCTPHRGIVDSRHSDCPITEKVTVSLGPNGPILPTEGPEVPCFYYKNHMPADLLLFCFHGGCMGTKAGFAFQPGDRTIGPERPRARLRDLFEARQRELQRSRRPNGVNSASGGARQRNLR
jgi:hypothetical protein